MYLNLFVVVFVASRLQAVTCASCEPSQFYIVKLQSERYVSNCPTLRNYRGLTVSSCLRLACRYRSDAISYRDNNCMVKRCGSSGLQLEQQATGWNIYVRDTDRPCDYDEGRTLNCYTCDSKTSDLDCMLNGRMEPCKHENSICYYKTLKTRSRRGRPSRVLSVSRGCRDRNECRPNEFTSAGECTSGSVMTQCKFCFYGIEVDTHHCLDGGTLAGALDRTCNRHFYLFGLRTNNIMSTCTRLAYSEGFSTSSCWRLACVIGGNTVNFRLSNGGCDVRLCQDNNLNIVDAADGEQYQLYTTAKDIKCDTSMNKVLACWTCEDETDFGCYVNGNMEDCQQPDSICGYEKIAQGNLVSQVTRKCRTLDSCSNTELLPPPGQCSAHQLESGDLADRCTQCMFETAGATYGCHDPFDVECHERYQLYTPVQGTLSVCTELVTANSHWLESCFQLACMLNANVVYHDKLQYICEVYLCVGNDLDEMILEEQTGYTIWAKDPDECAEGTYTCGDKAVCVDMIPGYTCDCLPGYGGDGKIGCTDVNECVSVETSSCGENAKCVNTLGSFYCECPGGYVGDANVGCTDIDECAFSNGGCATQGVCTNTPGSRFCTCPEGYTGDGFTCVGDPCICEVHGDPTSTTFDGTNRPLIGSKNYLLSENINSPEASCIFHVYVQTQHTDRQQSGDYFMQSVTLIMQENPASDSSVTVRLDRGGIEYQLDELSDYQPASIPGLVPGTALVTSTQDGSLHVQSEKNGCQLGLSVRFDELHPDGAKLLLETSRDYKLTGVCGNCNSQPDEWVGENGEDLSLARDQIEYINNAYGLDVL